jgi:hypothetical protein
MAKRKWLRVVLIGSVLLFAGSALLSRALRAGAARRYLIAHLTASFGRPVDVSWFEFSLLDGARIEAHQVTVSDDPQFGNEYLLRAETLAAGLRWPALLAGRLEFGPVSLTRASLNLARDAQGRWNIERWLPPPPQPGARPGFTGPVAPQRDSRAAQPAQIDVEDGRINFKQGDDKSPFALVDVSGRVEQTGQGRWQLDLEARPLRAGVVLQDIGVLRLRGLIAGTTARLQPAEINLTWRAASLADTLRLIRGDDYGMRGQLAVDLEARVAPGSPSSLHGGDSSAALWSISATARLTGIHGWRLVERDADPAANLSVDMNWRLGERRVEIQKLMVEMAGSHVQGAGDVDWSRGVQPQLRLESSTVALADILSWYRAMIPDVADDLQAQGVLNVNARLSGWPIRAQEGGIASAGGSLAVKSLPAPLHFGVVKVSVTRGRIEIAPAEISFAPAPAAAPGKETAAGDASRNSFVVRGALLPRDDGALHWPLDWNLSVEGATPRVQDWLALSGALAQPVNSGWTATGGMALKLRGSHLVEAAASGPAGAPWVGTADSLGLTLEPAYVNQPVRLPKAHMEFAPAQRIIAFSAAEAFGAVWRGSISRKYNDPQWSFDLSADKIDAAELDRWLGPRARPGFLARFTGGAPVVSAAPPAAGVVTRLAARGRLRAAIISVPPMQIEQFDGQAELDGRTVRIRDAQADFFGGRVSGSFDAQLLPDPSYVFQGRFDRVNLAQLARAVPFLADRIGGSASSTLSLSAHGIGRQDLIASMQGQGSFSGRNDTARGLALYSELPEEGPDPLPEVFASVEGSYRIRDKGIDVAGFAFENSRGRLEAEGRIDFSHSLNLRLRPSFLQAAAGPPLSLAPYFLMGGTIEAPRLIVPPTGPKPAARAASR